jgi:hypothetical protein
MPKLLKQLSLSTENSYIEVSDARTDVPDPLFQVRVTRGDIHENVQVTTI